MRCTALIQQMRTAIHSNQIQHSTLARIGPSRHTLANMKSLMTNMVMYRSPAQYAAVFLQGGLSLLQLRTHESSVNCVTTICIDDIYYQVTSYLHLAAEGVPYTPNEAEKEIFERPENSPDRDNHPWLNCYYAGPQKQIYQNVTGHQKSQTLVIYIYNQILQSNSFIFRAQA